MGERDAYIVTEIFENKIADYCGADFCITIDNCSNALFLCLLYENVFGQTISIPCRTYPSVPCAVIQSGAKVNFLPCEKETITGAYRLLPTRIYDSALRFTKDMFIKDSLMCLSFSGAYKRLKLGKGGAILTDDAIAAAWFKRMRFSGRNECSYHKDHFDMIGYNMYLLPELAARGLILMNEFYNNDGTKKEMPDISLAYPDLSQFDVYKR